MNVITPITFTNQSVTVEAGQTYQLVDNQGQPLKKFGVEAQDDTLTVKLQDEGITLKIQQYQQANFVAPQDAQISGDAQLISLFETGDTAVAEQIATNFSPTILWWTIGSVLTLSTSMLLFGRKKSKPTAPLAPKNEASLADITDDNTLNLSESQTQITVRGALKNVPENATLKLLLDANPLDIEIIRNGEQFSAEISGERLSHGQQLSLQVHNEKGEVLTQVNKNYGVKLSTSDTLALEIADITDDNTINNNESQNKVQLKINVSGLDNDAQGTLTILDGDMALGQREVTGNGEMLFQIDGNKLTTGNVKAVLNVKDEVANTNSADKLHPYSIDTAITPPTITIDQVANQNTITRQDLRNPQLPIELTISNLDADSQATLRLYNNQQLIGTAPVKQNGKFTVNVNGANIVAERIEAVIDAQDNAHNQIQSRTHKTITLNTHFPQAEVQIISIADDGVINQAKTETTQNVVLAIRGITPETSNRVVLKDGNQELTSQTVAQNGELRLTVAGEQLTSGQLRAEIYTTYQGKTLSREDNKTYTLDTQIARPTVEVRSIAGDNVITKAEQANPIEVKVNVGNLTDTDLKTKTVSLYQGNELLGSQNAVNGENIFRIPANKLNGGSLVAKIKVEDNAGNLAENPSNPTAYTVKNSVAVPSVAIEKISDNNLINLAKSKLVQEVVVNISNLETGATARVELSQNGTLLASREAISANGKITLSVPANSLKTNSLSAKIIATDKYSQTAEATSELFNFTLDTGIQTPTVTLGDIGTNNLINQANSQTTHNLTVTVAGLPNGSLTRVELLDGTGKQLSAPQTFNSNGDKTFPIAQSALTQGDGQIIAKYHTVSASGNEATLNSKAKAYTLDTQITQPTVEVRSIAGDNVITKAEQANPIEVKVNVGNLTDTDLKTKTVSLYQGNELLTSQNAVNGENIFRIPANKLNGGSLVAKINVADNAGNLAESQSNPTAYTVKNSVAVPTVAIEKISDNNLINLAKSKLVQEVVVNISNLETGATARVELSQNGTLLASREAISANGKITLSVPANSLKTNSLSAKIIATDKYSQTAEATSELFNFTLDTGIQTPTVTLGDIATNNLINQANSQTTHNLTVTVADLPNGSRTTVELLDGAGKQLSAPQTFNSNGDKTFPIAQSALTQGNGQIIAKYHTVSASGNELTLNSETKAYTLDTQITTPTVEVRSIAGDNVITKAEQASPIEVKVNVGNLTDTDLKTKTVSLYQDNELLGSQNAVNGENIFRIPANKLNGGSLVAKIKVEDNAGNLAENPSNPTAYTVKNSVAVPSVAIEKISDNNLINLAKSKLVQEVVVNISNLETGATARVELSQNGTLLASRETISANGKITLSVPANSLKTNSLSAKIIATDKYSQTAEATSELFNFTLDTGIQTPTVTLGDIATNNLINQANSQTTHNLTVTVADLPNGSRTTVELLDGAGKQLSAPQTFNSNGDKTFPIAQSALTQGNGQIIAKYHTVSASGNELTLNSETKAYTLDTQITTPTVEVRSIAGDNVITKAEQASPIEVKVNVGNLTDTDLKTKTVSLYQGDELLGSQNAVNGENIFRIPANKLNGGSLVAKIKVEDNAGNLAENPSNPTAYTVKNSVAVPTISFVSVAGQAVNNNSVAEMLSPRTVTAETVPVILNVSGLEEQGKGTLTLSLNGVVKSTSTVNANGQVTLSLNKTDLINATNKVLTANLSAQDKYLNPAVNAEAVSTNYQTDFQINRPTVEILTIGGETQYELYEHQVSQAQIPVRLKVSNLDSDASGQITLKIGETQVETETARNNGETTITLSGEQLSKGNRLTAELSATDRYGNKAETSTFKDYSVDNFITIKQIDADFNITFTDTRQAGTLLSGELLVEAKLQKGFEYLQSSMNQGDVWRWLDSVKIEFDDGSSYIVPVTHQDDDDDSFTADPNVVHYALALTASEWRDLGGKSFKITPERLKDRAGKIIESRFFLGGINDNIFQESSGPNGELIQKLGITVTPKENNDVIQNSDTSYPYTLKPYNPKTFISGFAGGNDVKPNDEVTLDIGGRNFTTRLKEDKSFYIEVDSEVLLNNPSTTVKASLKTEVGEVKDESRYLSSAIAPTAPVSTTSNTPPNEGSNPQEISSVNTVKDLEWDELPYFIKALNYDEHLRFGFVQGHVSGGAITIKYSFAKPNDSATLSYMQDYNSKLTGKNIQFRYNIAQMVEFNEQYKAYVRSALEKISSRTKITFKEEENFLRDGEGMNFFMFPFFLQDGETATNNVTSGFAAEGGNVRLNTLVYQGVNTDAESTDPTNTFFTTTLHEVMHALGMKHPFVGDGKNGEHNDHHVHDVDEIHEQHILVAAENRNVFTLMSYENDISTHGDDLRVLDLINLHYRYGVNPTQRNGDDIYTFKEFNKRSVDGDIYIWDGGGKDTFNAENAEQKVYINLTPGSWIHTGQKSKTLLADDVANVAEQDYFNDRTFTHRDNYLGYIFNKLYPTYKVNSGQAFIGYGTVIENAVGSRFDDEIIGNDANNLLEGGEGNDILKGGRGNDVLDGGKGYDTMEGGDGDDVYFVDRSSSYDNDRRDRIIEKANEGRDTVYSEVHIESAFDNIEIYRLLGRENLSLSADFYPGLSVPYSQNIELYGNQGNNTLRTGSGDDILDGSEGADRMVGRAGNDTYYVDNINDEVLENWGEGEDTIYSSISLSKATAFIETYRLQGHADLDLRINNLPENQPLIPLKLYGNQGNNTLHAGDGNDILDGGEGADKLYGGGGDDTYYLNTLEDRAIELNREGYDTVYTKNSYTLGKEDYIEKVVLMEEPNAQMITASLAEDDYLKQYDGNYTNVTKFGQIMKEEINFTAVGNNHANIFDITIARSLHNAHSSVKPIGIIEGKEGNDRFILTLEMQDNGHPANLTNKPELSLFSSLEARVENGTLHIHGISAPQSPHQTFDVIDVNSNSKLFEGTITDGQYTDTIPLERLGENPRLRFSPTGKGDVMSIGSAEVSVSGDSAEVSYNHLREVSLEDHPAFVLKDFEAGKDQLSFNFQLNNNIQSKDLFSVKEDTLYFERENTEYNYSYKLALVKFENGIPTNLLEII